MEHSLEKKYPVSAKDYKPYEEVGEGVSATVYRALCIPFNEIVAIKVLDLEKCNNDLDGIRREVHTMSLIDHPNVLRAHCSFTSDHSLWVVMPYMSGGSCLHIMKSAYPEGFEEPVIATLLHEVLKPLVYLHAQGHIHRDVKAGNILIDSSGAVKLADFGVSACMFDTGDRQRSRNTFVGTPCWMAPEVMQQLHGYDFKADIWSFGITALELAHGHAPFSKYPPMKVLLMTLQNAPPGLDYERDKRFSKSFKEMVAACLVKDPKKRPTSEKLMKHPFFKHARSNEYLTCTILEGLAPLGDRFRMLKAKEADLLVQNKALYEDKEQLSQQEYIRGISAWNFNMEDLKTQAALIQDFDGNSTAEYPEANKMQRESHGDDGFLAGVTSGRSKSSKASHENGLDGIQSLESPLTSFPIQPLQALKGCFDVCEEDDVGVSSPPWKDSTQSESQQQFPEQLSSRAADQEAWGNGDDFEPKSSLPQQGHSGRKKFLSGSLIQENFQYPKKFIGGGVREALQPRQSDRNYSGPLMSRQRRETNNASTVEDASEAAVVQRKGRFKVTSAELGAKASSNCSINPACGGAASPASSSPTAAMVPLLLHCILQQNNMQRDEIMRLIKYVEQISRNNGITSPESGANELSQVSSTTEKEQKSQLIQLQHSVTSLTEELHRLQSKNAQLEMRLKAMTDKEQTGG